MPVVFTDRLSLTVVGATFSDMVVATTVAVGVGVGVGVARGRRRRRRRRARGRRRRRRHARRRRRRGRHARRRRRRRRGALEAVASVRGAARGVRVLRLPARMVAAVPWQLAHADGSGRSPMPCGTYRSWARGGRVVGTCHRRAGCDSCALRERRLRAGRRGRQAERDDDGQRHQHCQDECGRQAPAMRVHDPHASPLLDCRNRLRGDTLPSIECRRHPNPTAPASPGAVRGATPRDTVCALEPRSPKGACDADRRPATPSRHRLGADRAAAVPGSRRTRRRTLAQRSDPTARSWGCPRRCSTGRPSPTT